jgi:deferrochelatase/peroxidase EfeB
MADRLRHDPSSFPSYFLTSLGLKKPSQVNLRSGFIKIFEKMSRFDMLNQFVTNTAGGHFVCPRGTAKDEFIGQRLFEAAS